MPRLVLKDEILAGVVDDVAANNIGDNQIVTAFRSQTGKLGLIRWKITPQSKIKRIDGTYAGGISKIALTSLSHNTLITAFQGESDRLGIIAWEVLPLPALPPATNIHRIGDTYEHVEITAVAVQALTKEMFVTAVRTFGKLKLTSWHFTSQSGFKRYDEKTRDTEIDPKSPIAIGRWGSNYVFIAAKASKGPMFISLWHVANTGEVNLRGHADGDSVSKFSLTVNQSISPAPGVYNEAVTAGLDQDGVKLQGWKTTIKGNLQKVGSPFPKFAVKRPKATEISLSPNYYKSLPFGLASNDPNGLSNDPKFLRVMSFRRLGVVFKWADDARGMTKMEGPPVILETGDGFLVVSRNHENKLRLSLWEFET